MASKFKSNHNNSSSNLRKHNGNSTGTKTILSYFGTGSSKITANNYKLCHQNGELKRRRDDLPVNNHTGEFFKLLNESQSVVVVGETGSGKTTQIPQWCVDYCRKKMRGAHVACTQPRRIAAMSVAARVAAERGSDLGKEVGYEVRFESRSSPHTRLVYLTDGMLLREAAFHKDLPRYGIIIIDEAHERTLQTEILFGIIKRALINRNSGAKKVGGDEGDVKPLKVVIMSATINVKLFSKFFDAPLLRIEGRQHAVHNMTTQVTPSDLLISTLTCVFQIHRNCEDGDILVFCSGQDEIQTLVILTNKALRYAAIKPSTDQSMLSLIPLPLYASLPAAQQMQVFDRNLQIAKKLHSTSSITNGKSQITAKGDHDMSDDSMDATVGPSTSSSLSGQTFRRVIYATNVAETSVTIPNIKYVIDTGKVKCRTYCPKTALESLKLTTISKAQAEQRAGRAGRIAPGTCYRLYTSDDFDKMSDHLAPEIKRCNLDSVLMQLIAISSDNVKNFEFLERPETERIVAALRNLLSLKAIMPAKDKTKLKPSHSAGAITNGNSASASTTPSSSSSTPSPETESSSQGTPTPDLSKINPASMADDEIILNLNYDLTSLGRKLQQFPLHPTMARVILAADDLGCLDEALTVVSLLSIENLFHFPPNKQDKANEVLRKFHSNEGDTIMMLNVFRAFRRTSVLNRKGLKQWCMDHFIHIKNLKLARLIRKQLLQVTKKMGMQSSTCSQDTTMLRRALTYGLFKNVATLWDGGYRNIMNLTSNKEVFIHPSSCLFKSRPEKILYLEVVETSKCYMRVCTLTDMNWIREAALL